MRKPSKKIVSKSKKKAAKRPVRRVKKIVPKMIERTLRPKPFVEKLVSNGEAALSAGDSRLPTHYGEDKLALLVRDPWWIYAYWEVTPGRREQAESQLKKDGQRGLKTVLRVYDITRGGLSQPDSFFDIELIFFADNWYIDVGIPDHEWMAELGLRAASGKFIALSRSNVVRTPSFGVSEVLDEEWMLPEDIYYQIIGLTGPGGPSGSMDIRKLLEKYLKQVVSSESAPKVSPLKK